MTPANLPSEHILLLAEKWTNGTITAEEQQEFIDWYNSHDDQELLFPGKEGVKEKMHGQLISAVHSTQTGTVSV